MKTQDRWWATYLDIDAAPWCKTPQPLYSLSPSLPLSHLLKYPILPPL